MDNLSYDTYDTAETYLFNRSIGIMNPMKIIGYTITKEEANLFCERLFWLSQARPRLRETLELDGDPKLSPLAQKIARQLVLGKLIIVDNNKKDVVVCGENRVKEFNNITLLPADIPEIEVHLHNHRNSTDLGPISLLKLYHLLPTLNLEELSLWHTGIEKFVNLAELKIRLIGS